jgi:tetratricopeptide (TPR) repeat protein
LIVLRAGALLLLLLAAWPAGATPYSDFNAGIVLRNSDECREAIARFDAALAAPDLLASLRPVALHGRGICHAELKEIPAALGDLGASLRLDPDDYDTRLDRASIFVELKRYDEAEADLRELQRLRPDLTPGYTVLGAMYEKQGKYRQAIDQFSIPIKNHTNPAAGYALRAHAYIAYGRTADALDDAEDLIKLLPRALGLRAWVYELRGEYDDAMRDVDAMITQSPANFELRRGKATLYWKMGRFDDAANILTGFDPSDGYAVLWLSILRAAGAKPAGDLAPHKTDPKKWPAPLIALYQDQGTPESVSAAVAADGPDNSERDACESAFYVGEWHLTHGDTAAARPLLQQAASDCPVDYIEKDAARVQLERLK